MWQRGLVALGQELGRPIAISFSDSQARLLTPEAAEALLADLRKLAAEGTI